MAQLARHQWQPWRQRHRHHYRNHDQRPIRRHARQSDLHRQNHFPGDKLMAAIDLITNARARQALPSAQGGGSTDDTAINTLITACSRAIMRYCRRNLVSDTYDELYNGRGERQIFLRNYPLQSVQSVRYRPVTVLKITNNLANTPQARVEVTSTGLRLTRITNGVKTTD